MQAELAEGASFAEGAYIIRTLLARGGMGSVYSVTQTSTGRERALKVMHPQLVGDEKMRRRFVQEAQVVARIESEHVVDLVDVGDDVRWGPFIVLERLHGETLAARIARAPLSIGEALHVVEQICHALSAAHRAGVVHRDLTDDNVFLAKTLRAGSPTCVKILDFGLAKDATTRASGAFGVGTPLAMAPEQLERGGLVGPATDLWALGLLVFEMLTGKSFWREAAKENPSVVALAREIVHDSIPWASIRAKELGVAELVSNKLDPWFARALSREVPMRFSRADEAYVALADAAGVPTLEVEAPPRSIPPPRSSVRNAQIAVVRPKIEEVETAELSTAPISTEDDTMTDVVPASIRAGAPRALTAAELHDRYRLARKKDALDRAWCVAATLVARREADASESRLYAMHAPSAVAEVERPIQDADWDTYVAPKEQDRRVGSIFATVRRAVLATKVVSLKIAKQLPDFPRRGRQDESSTHPLARAFFRAARLLALDPPLLYFADEGPRLAPQPVDPPVSFANPAKMTLGGAPFDDLDLAFVAGRHLAEYRPEYHVLALFPSYRELRVVFLGALRLVEPSLPTPDTTIERDVVAMTRALEKQIHDDELRTVRALATPILREPSLPDLLRWRQHVDVACVRAGLLCAGDVTHAYRLLEEGVGDGEATMSDLSKAIRLEELARYAAGDLHATMRERLGLALR